MGLLSAAAKTAIQNGDAVLGFLLELQFVPGTERYWTGGFPLVHDSVTWQPTGGQGALTPIQSSSDFRANGLSVTLHGIPVTTIRSGSLRAADYKGQSARVIFAMLQGETVIHAAPKYYYIDRVNYAIQSGLAGVTVQLEHETTYGARQSVRRYSDADQQNQYPGDRALEFLAFLSSGVEVRWGANGSTFKN